ncbi:pyruvate/2-oxoglutarate dehydrogenase complex dihydrolipoamide dehydrogenase (E3) component [Algoriphagus ratkowskyi]|uniref:NAD(P)/FAD-dependent oxidoreductase n=1 Tax=Algoriphagus ratkowskyi TaxID=57028 RepID=A0A2W7RR82_9BACT|nr:NAD(P)/FAD-dependent oxidoreductase [Algoriphagus ratkowskyi]PZX57029.1 pyruvate/2-oxoglutarate dehydrogenase complex dihydrolipoamide dehydrogenase (E3) component [Algoriphagus ratkowskyi]TXD79932.1 NAD(P)/FAD-dependent oxidoreductase [Algoriphagus ratkowskyi]
MHKKVNSTNSDVIVIGAGSGGLSVGLFLAKVGISVIMIVKSDKEVGGECLNDGCVPSKALIHVARQVNAAREAEFFGIKLVGEVDIQKAMAYVYAQQEVIRKHENAAWLSDQGITVVLGEASFSGKNEVTVDGKIFSAKKIILATGSKPRKLQIDGVEKVNYFDNENIFHIKKLPKKLLVVGAGPIGIEIAQAMCRLGSKVTVVQKGHGILAHDDQSLTSILLKKLQEEGIVFHFNASLEKFTSPTEALVKKDNGEDFALSFDGVFVGVGRILVLEPLKLALAGIEVKDHKIVIDDQLRTTNKNVLVCGDIAGDLQFSHAAEFHGRIILNNLFSPITKKLNNDHMSWVTFTDPEIATFGLSEKQLQDRGISFEKLDQDFSDDHRAVTDTYRYARTILYITKGGLFKKEKILGGSMVAPNAGELIQELILANTLGLSINSIFNKIYPYPVATRINQQVIVRHKQKKLTSGLKKLLNAAFKIFG